MIIMTTLIKDILIENMIECGIKKSVLRSDFIKEFLFVQNYNMYVIVD
jgi:hypothetical protein